MSDHSIAAAQARDRDDVLSGFRDRFVVRDPDQVYLCGNSLGRLPVSTRDALHRLLDEWAGDLVRGWTRWGGLARQAGDEIAGVIGAESGEVIVSDSTSLNIYKLAVALLEHRSTRRVIVTDDNEFPSDLYVLQGLRRREGYRLRVIPTDPDGGIEPAQVAAAVRDDTALVVFSHVAYLSGAVADMAEVTRIVHDAGAVMLWDLCHSAGAVRVPLDASGVDLAVGCTYKYLNAGPGAPAFLYVRKGLQRQLLSPIWGWFGRADRFEMDARYQPVDSIERFLVSTPDVFGCLAALHGARLIGEAGIDRIHAKGKALTAYAVELVDAWLAGHGVRLASPREADRRGCHLTLHHPLAWQVCQAAADRRVVVDYRNPDRIRIGLAPIYTSFADVHEGLSRLRDVLDSRAHLAYPATHASVT